MVLLSDIRREMLGISRAFSTRPSKFARMGLHSLPRTCLEYDCVLTRSPLSDQSDQPENAPAAAEAASLEHIVDDSDARESAAEFARKGLLAGRIAEDVAADLVAEGWSEEVAAEIAERARVETRRERGVLVRDDVVQSSAARYRQSMAAARWLGFGVLWSSVYRLICSIRDLLRLRRLQRESAANSEQLPPPPGQV